MGDKPMHVPSRCRFCGNRLDHTFIDLGMSPLCESYLKADQVNQMEPFYPLHVYVCGECFLVQLQEYVPPKDIFNEYAYFSSYSTSWCRHAKAYADTIIERLGLAKKSRVVEIGSNDGYLLEHFVARGIPVVGVEPAANVAEAAKTKGVPTLVEFFGKDTAEDMAAKGHYADLLIANNTLAQIPDINDCIAGMKILLAPNGVITVEFSHITQLIEGNQFDTVYHEHFYYFSFAAAERIFASHGLSIFDVDQLPTHGGSLRIYARHDKHCENAVTDRVRQLKVREEAQGVTDLAYYRSFTERVHATKHHLLEFLIGAKREGKSVVGYGAPGKGNTLLNYCGIRTDLLEYTVDRNPYKQGKFLPGTHIPIHHPRVIVETKPNYVLILPWNIKDEVIEQNAFIGDWGGRFVIPIPELNILTPV